MEKPNKKSNLLEEGIKKTNDFVKGNKMYNATQGYKYKILYPERGANVGKNGFIIDINYYTT